MGIVPLDETGQARMFLGASGTGKTQTLIESIADRIDHGVAISEILVFQSSPHASRSFAERLHGVGVDAGVRVCCPQELALEILGTPEAKAFTRREARLLLPYEEAIFLEDMKVLGIREKRLREMLKYFSRNWTELVDVDDTWLLEGEESIVHAYVKGCLDFMEAMLQAEVVNFAVKYLLASPSMCTHFGYRHVLVDDYQSLSRASQVFASKLAGESIVAAADPFACIDVFDPFPYRSGIEEFSETNGHASIETLHTGYRSLNSTRMTNIFLSEGNISSLCDQVASSSNGGQVRELPCKISSWGKATSGSFASLSFKTMQHELEGIVRLVGQAKEKGFKACDIFIVCPHKTWKKKVQRALEQRGEQSSSLEDGSEFHARAGTLNSNANAFLMALLMLIADSRSAASWRCLCGIDESRLTESLGFKWLREYAKKRELGLYECLSGLNADAIANAGPAKTSVENIMLAFHRVQRVLQRCGGLRGNDLLAALCRDTLGCDIPEKLKMLLGEVDGAATASDMVERVLGRIQSPRFREEASRGGIRIVGLDELMGENPQVMLFVGFENGILPIREAIDAMETVERDRERMRNEDIAKLYCAIPKARSAFIGTWFASATPEEGEALRLKVNRVRLVDGRRVCTTEVSDYLTMLEPQH